MARKIAIGNEKGGIGKTTTTVQLGIGLAKEGNRVLLVDTDPQGHVARALGWEKSSIQDNTISNLFRMTMSGNEIDDSAMNVILTHSEGVDVLPSNFTLSKVKLDLFSEYNREKKLKEILSYFDDKYDYMIIDMNPNVDLMTTNVLTACDSVILTISLEDFCLDSTEDFLQVMGVVKKVLNPNIKMEGVLMTMKDSRTKMDREVEEFVREYFNGQNIYTPIPYMVETRKASRSGVSVYSFAPVGKVAEAYRQLTNDVINNQRYNETEVYRCQSPLGV